MGRGSFAAWLRLAKPIPATFGEARVLVLDLGPSGALLSGQCDVEQGAEHEPAFLDGRGNVKVRVTGVADHGLSPHRDLLVRFHAPDLFFVPGDEFRKSGPLITASGEQPPDGFTISAAETEDQVTLLQLAYEESDEDERNALREFAAVSLPPARRTAAAGALSSKD